MSDVADFVFDADGWYVARKKREVFSTLRDWREEWLRPGATKTMPQRKTRFRVRGRVKEVFRYRVNVVWYHVMAPAMGAPGVEHYPDPLAFSSLSSAIKAGEALAGMKNMEDRAKAIDFIDAHRLRA